MGLKESDLHKLNKEKMELTYDHYKVFLVGVLLATQYMHRSGILHRDIVSSCLLLNSCKKP